MLRITSLLIALCALTIAVVGCGSGEGPLAPAPSPGPPTGGDPVTHEVGPLVVRAASAAGFVAEDIPTDGEVTLVALHGCTIEYLASQAMLDRIVFASERDGSPGEDIWICNLDGSHLVQLTKNTANEVHPCWSPDGTKIVFVRQWPYIDTDIVVMNADGSGIRALTANTDMDTRPCFSPDGRRIAFESDRSANSEIWVMFADGSDVRNVTSDSSCDTAPDWSPLAYDPRIFFVSDRATTYDIYSIDPDLPGAAVLAVSAADNEWAPSHHPFQQRLAFHKFVGAAREIFVTEWGYTAPRNLSATPENQEEVAWSTDGRYVCYESSVTGDPDIVLQEVEEPYSKWALTHNAVVYDQHPDLGSPTMQTDRVLIGPAGADWGGNDPIWSAAYAAIAAFSTDGYENLVRIGISAAHVGSLQIAPLSQTAAGGERPAGVVVEAAKIVNLREDAGRGREPTVWDLGPLGVTAAALYFDPQTGKLIAVLALDDATYPSAAGSPAIAERPEGSGLVVTGSFTAVFDAAGNRVAGPSSQVVVAAEGPVVR